jgi:rhodanese-related sulfurtransferase
VESVTPGELRDLTGMTIVDIRKNPDDRQIPGSQRMEGAALESATPFFSKDERVVLYCGSGNSCGRIAASLRERGYDAVALEGGYAAWKEAQLPTEPASNFEPR